MSALAINFPNKLTIGKDTFLSITNEITEASLQSAFIIVTPALKHPVDSLMQSLKDNNVMSASYSEIDQEPTFNDFEETLKHASDFNPDVVIGVGGGSVLDVTKLIAAQLDDRQSLHDMVGSGKVNSRERKLICVPTTAGTGSEVSPNAILQDEEENLKKGIISPYLVPDSVYLDPMLMLDVPPRITASTGLDALTHCLEAYINKNAHPFIDMYALEGMKLISNNLIKAVDKGDDLDARISLARGSLLGGFCLGPVNTAAVHALSYPLGSKFHLPHGLSNALLLPHVMEFSMEAAPQRYAEVAVAIGCKYQENDYETAKKGIEKINDMIKACGIPAKLSELNITENDIPDMATDAMKIERLLKNNPRPVNRDDAINIYKAAF